MTVDPPRVGARKVAHAQLCEEDHPVFTGRSGPITYRVWGDLSKRCNRSIATDPARPVGWVVAPRDDMMKRLKASADGVSHALKRLRDAGLILVWRVPAKATGLATEYLIVCWADTWALEEAERRIDERAARLADQRAARLASKQSENAQEGMTIASAARTQSEAADDHCVCHTDVIASATQTDIASAAQTSIASGRQTASIPRCPDPGDLDPGDLENDGDGSAPLRASRALPPKIDDEHKSPVTTATQTPSAPSSPPAPPCAPSSRRSARALKGGGGRRLTQEEARQRGLALGFTPEQLREIEATQANAERQRRSEGALTHLPIEAAS